MMIFTGPLGTINQSSKVQMKLFDKKDHTRKVLNECQYFNKYKIRPHYSLANCHDITSTEMFFAKGVNRMLIM